MNKRITRLIAMLLVMALCVTVLPKTAATEAQAATFKDVGPTHWAYAYVEQAVADGLFKGISGDTFGPELTMDRGMFVTVLSRMAGVSVDNQAETGFSDVPAGTWYTGAVAWAAAEGITTGVTETTFESQGGVTFSVKADEGYEVFSVTADAGTLTDNGDGTYTLTGLTSAATVRVVATGAEQPPVEETYTVTFVTDGGVVNNYHGYSNFYADGVWFHDNKTRDSADAVYPQTGMGGALWINCWVAEIKNCVFENNWAATGGGAIATLAIDDLVLENCTFTGDTILINGGKITNCYAGSTYGGTVRADKVTMTAGEISNCTGKGYYGGAAIGAKNIEITGGEIYGCASNTSYGGVLYAQSNGTILINGGTFINHNAGSVGSSNALVYMYEAYAYIQAKYDMKVENYAIYPATTYNEVYLGSLHNLEGTLGFYMSARDCVSGRRVAQGYDHDLTWEELAKVNLLSEGYTLELNQAGNRLYMK